MHSILFRNGRLHCPNRSWVGAADILVQAGQILRIGVGLDVGNVPEFDLAGRSVIPGPVDAHCHLVSFGLQETREANLRGTRSIDEIAARIRAHADSSPSGATGERWLLGRGFDQELLVEGRWPTRDDLDRIAPEVPLRIVRICGHAMVANSAALRRAGLDPDVERPGFPPGGLTEEAMSPVHCVIPPPSAEEWSLAALRGSECAVRAGFVGVHSLMANADEVRALVDLHQRGALPLRVVMQLPYSLLAHARNTGLRTGFGDEVLSLGAVKLFSDGSLGARTAALREPYADDPSTSGELIYAQEELTRRILDIYQAGFQACVHAIGDAAMDATLDAMEASAAMVYGGKVPPAPPRIEHASLITEDMIPRMQRLGVGAAIQPQFAWSDTWTPDRLGSERLSGCYAFRTMWEAGIPLGGSTDCPVEPLSAMSALGKLVHWPDWLPTQGLPLASALRIFSEGSYRLLGRPAGTGTLSVGQPADFVVLEEHPDQVQPHEIAEIPVRYTIVGGIVRYAAH